MPIPASITNAQLAAALAPLFEILGAADLPILHNDFNITGDAIRFTVLSDGDDQATATYTVGVKN